MATILELYKQSEVYGLNPDLYGKEEVVLEHLFDSMYLPDLAPKGSATVYDPLFMQYREYYNEILVPTILMECGHFEASCDDVATLKYCIEVWSKARAGVWSDLVRTTAQHYNLTHNYDRTEEWTERRLSMETGNSKGNSEASSSGNGSSSVSAYDSADMTPREKSTNSASGNSNTSGNYSRDNEDDFERKVKAFGNIGVTTAQQMLEEERKLVRFNIVYHIVNEFKQQFCILVY